MNYFYSLEGVPRGAEHLLTIFLQVAKSSQLISYGFRSRDYGGQGVCTM